MVSHALALVFSSVASRIRGGQKSEIEHGGYVESAVDNASTC